MPPSSQEIAKRLGKWGIPQAAGLTTVYGFCTANGFEFPAFVVGALASGLTVESVRGICRRLGGATGPEVTKNEMLEFCQRNSRGLEELAAVVLSVQEEIGGLPEKQRRKLRADHQKEIEAQAEDWGKRILDVVGAAPFDVHGSIGGLLAEVSRVSSHGLANVVDRPESKLIVTALHGRVTSQIFLKGRALSGKTFLAFKVAQHWIVNGGQVAWMRSGADITHYIAGIQSGRDQNGRLPLIVWEVPHRDDLRGDVFDQLQRYDGPVLTTVRVGGLRNLPLELDELLEEHGFAPGFISEHGLSPTERKVSVFLGAIADANEVLSATVRAGNHRVTFTEDVKNEIASRIRVTEGAQSTTLLGLAKAYLMAFDRLKVCKIDQQALSDLEGPNRESLSSDVLVRRIFAQTIDEDDGIFLSSLKLYRAWTFGEAIHEHVLTAILQNMRSVLGIAVRDRRNSLKDRGILIYHKPYYSFWHDLQQEVLATINSATEADILSRTVEYLTRELEEIAERSQKAKYTVVLSELAMQLAKCGHWKQALCLHLKVLAVRRKIANNHEGKSQLASTCNNLGSLLTDMGNLEEAKERYDEAVAIRSELANEDPKKHSLSLSHIYNNLGKLHYLLGSLQLALEFYQKAFDTCKDNADNTFEIPKDFEATIYSNMGVAFDGFGDVENAKILFEKALSIRQDLAEDQPKAFLPYVATTYSNLGVV